jgi:hypothetical protein
MAVSPPARDLLAWIAARPRTYDETLEAWHSHCPRLTVWEDAISDELIRIERPAGGRSMVVLTIRGRAALDD